MGGSITIAARFNNGDAVCIDGWTNFMPWMIINDTTFSGDDSIVRKVLMEATEQDYYAGPVKFEKSGYGIVVIDFKERELHTIQGYCSFTNRWIGQLVDINKSDWQDGKFKHILSEEGESLVKAGRVFASRIPGEPEEQLTLEMVVSALEKDSEAMRNGRLEEYKNIRIDTAPFVVHDYGETGAITPIKARMKETGFPLTRKEGLNAIFNKAKENGK